MEIEVRRMAEGDTDSVLELMRALAIHHDQLAYVRIDRDTFMRHAFHGDPAIGACVAEKDGELIGYVSYTKSFSIWAGSTCLLVDDVFVKPAFRSLGVGERMMRFIRREAVAAGVNMVRWEVEKDNHRAIRFYKRLGADLRVKGICSWSV